MSKTATAVSSEAIKRWRTAEDTAAVILTVAAQAGVIAEVAPTPGGFDRFIREMTSDEQSALDKLTSRPDKRQIAAACKLAGTNYDAARARLMTDTPENRRAAARAFNLL